MCSAHSSRVPVAFPPRHCVDLTGLGGLPLSFLASQITSGSIAAQTIGWQQAGGNTSLNVNVSTSSKTRAAADMKIQLTGNVSITGGDVLHL